jgi:valyl-tRNA synthetase
MEKTYNPEQIERHWYPVWEQSGYFIPSNQGPSYCIMLPPPNVTGTLHMGHGFQVSLMDALVRYHRMHGFNTLWQAGTDHAGIATQMVVERQLLQQNITRQSMGREAFVDRIWEWKNQSDGTIKRQLRRMGASLDWTRERFSMDEDISEAVKEVFVSLYEENLIYRGKRLVNWDPVLLTAVSDLEVVLHEETGKLWHIRYPLCESREFIIVATTRPETLLGDTAVAVHPDDERYRHLIGKFIQHPLTERKIPIIADEYVDKEFGSGAVKITPAHDFNDYAIAQRHQLEMINILTPDAHINENAPSAYRGLERFKARERVVKDLENLGLIEKIEPHVLKIPHGDRTDAVIEPYLTDQWYVNAKLLAKPAIEAVQQNKIQFVPENWTKTYFQWLEDIEDWCISRQLWWGHRIPAWYDDAGNVYVGKNEAELREKYHLDPQLKLRQDDDVLDTWFSAALWPFATLGWPQKTPELATFYPTSVLVTGFDIIFFWVARMVMMGLKFTGEVPFRQVYITGLIRDSEGQKMSKSKGNILDPLDLMDGISLEKLIAKRTAGLMQPEMAKNIEKTTRKEYPDGIPAFGTDALRFTYCALATTGRDVRFDLGRIEGYRNFCNKIWNAARYVLMNCENQDTGIQDEVIEFSLADHWIRSQLHVTIQRVTEYFAHYRFDQLAHVIYEFIWNEYCDWYLELSKPILTSTQSTAAQLRGTRQTLVYVLETLLRLIHPLMPFISEEIWQRVAPLSGKQGPSIMLQSYPVYDASQIDLDANAEIEWLKQMILAVRNIRGEMNISPAKPLPLILYKGNATDKQRVADHGNFLKTLARLESIKWLTDKTDLALSATALVDALELHIPLAGIIDKTAEVNRLNKEVAKLQKDLEKIELKLNNKNYIEKAPAPIVEKERVKAKEIHTAIEKLREQCEYLEHA